MKISKQYIIIFIQIAFLLISISSGFCWSGKSEMESALLNKIQQARTNPAKALADLNIDPRSLITCYPDLEPYLDGGLVELLQDQRLFFSADQYAEEMVKAKHFSKISPDGSTPGERFQKYSYYSAASAEAQGVLLFRNYFSKDAAVNALYKNIIENELKCTDNSKPIIFNPGFREIGLSIKSGSFDINGVKLNFYLAVVDVGVDIVKPVEKKTVLDMNLARISGDNLIEKMPPLQFDINLYVHAYKLAQKKIAEITQLPATEGLPIKAVEAAESGISFNQLTKAWITEDAKTFDQIATHFFLSVLRKDARLLPSEQTILNPDHTNTAVVIRSVESFFNENETFFVHVMVLVSGSRETPQELFNLSGVLYIDEDKDGKFTPGEGYRAGFIIIKNENGMEEMMVTGYYGEFNINGLLPGKYVVENGDVQNQIGFIEQELIVTNHNLFRFFDCEGAVIEEKN